MDEHCRVAIMEILAIDLGNTRASFGHFKSRELISRQDVEASQLSSLGKELSEAKFDLCVVSDVSQNRTIYDKWLKSTMRCPMLWVSARKAPLKILYDHPEGLGHDRIVNALAAKLYAPEGAIVVDLGTATHFDIVDPDGTFLGGPIVAGLDLIHHSLADRIAHLPDTQLKGPIEAVSKSTHSALQTGSLLMSAGGIDRIISVIRSALDFKPQVLLTGGNAPRIKDYISYDQWVPNLTLEGICRYGILLAQRSRAIA